MDRYGYCELCTVTNTAAAGDLPVEKLTIVDTAYYEKRTVGYNRMYAAMGANQSIDMLIRVFNTVAPTANKELYVVFPDDNSVQYRVAMVQEIVDQEALDLTLERMEDLYEVVEYDD